MRSTIPRRSFLGYIPPLLVLPPLLVGGEHAESKDSAQGRSSYPEFPAQDPSRVREMVGASHGNAVRVTEMLAESPALAKSTWDWGYGDWETAIGAASHVGSAVVARLLMSHGARPDIFTFAMLGELDVVRAYLSANPGIQKTHGPHGLTLMHHARKGGEPAAAELRYLTELGDADNGQTSAPLSERESDEYLGEYASEDGAAVRMRISFGKEGLLNLTRLRDGTDRQLFYLGNGEFHPTGASAVRVRFDRAEGLAKHLTIVDHQIVLNASRVR